MTIELIYDLPDAEKLLQAALKLAASSGIRLSFKGRSGQFSHQTLLGEVRGTIELSERQVCMRIQKPWLLSAATVKEKLDQTVAKHGGR